MILSRVDLPVPLGPTTPILAPWRNDRVTLSRTTLSPWALRTLRSVKTYSAMVRKPSAKRPWRPIRRSGRLTRPPPRARVVALAAVRGAPAWTKPAGAAVEVVADRVAVTSQVCCSTPSALTQVCRDSRPCTTTASPSCSEARSCRPGPPGVDREPLGLAVGPALAPPLVAPGRAGQPEARHHGLAGPRSLTGAAEVALQGHDRVVHRCLLSIRPSAVGRRGSETRRGHRPDPGLRAGPVDDPGRGAVDRWRGRGRLLQRASAEPVAHGRGRRPARPRSGRRRARPRPRATASRSRRSAAAARDRRSPTTSSRHSERQEQPEPDPAEQQEHGRATPAYVGHRRRPERARTPPARPTRPRRRAPRGSGPTGARGPRWPRPGAGPRRGRSRRWPGRAGR